MGGLKNENLQKGEKIMFRLDTKNDGSYFILYKNGCKYFKFSKRSNTLENVMKVLKEFYKIDYEII